MFKRISPKPKIASACLAALALAVAVPNAWAAETEYELVGCGTQKTVPVNSSPGFIAFGMENWAINTSTATKGWENATKHCVGYLHIIEGKLAGKGMCKWLDTSGDSAILEWETLPSGESTEAWIGGTGKYKGIKGGGLFAIIAQGKPVVEGMSFYCLRDSGKYSLP